MTKLVLSKRLKVIADMVNKDSVIADIGCDHALLDIYLSQNKIIKKSFACDITEGALDQAKKNISFYNINNVETRLGDGLDVIKKEDNVDTIIMSGLGNVKIVDILVSDNDKLKCINNIIIQSNTKPNIIRKELIKLGYIIKDERMVKENNIIYIIILFERGSKKYFKKDINYGPILRKNKEDLFDEYYKNIIRKNNKILDVLPKNKVIKILKIKIENDLIKKEIQK